MSVTVIYIIANLVHWLGYGCLGRACNLYRNIMVINLDSIAMGHSEDDI